MATQPDTPLLTHTERINQLNEIDKKVAKLLRSAGLALNALTKPSSPQLNDDFSTSQSVPHRKASFTAATTQYFALLSSIDVDIRLQIRALEEADILPSEAASKESQSDSEVMRNQSIGLGSRAFTSSRNNFSGGGVGSFDIGWLNSRNDSVSKEMQAELWKKASDFLVGIERSNGRS